ncbi:hypothetical protein [Streptomyces caeruleatus]|uniref:Secreted protein n=1 Tax=Streptomyces caeruleatus TaxID=661399 RepID=A0A101TSZ8_9ACTN|nr:hypothetical protein [Streptomyces caeruleatus]KUN97927.1 hypothetical protein AQJ67_28505 [Streptomyces caeruleatus]
MPRLTRTLAATALAVAVAGYAATEYLNASTPTARPSSPYAPEPSSAPEPSPPDCTRASLATALPTTLPTALPTASPWDSAVEAHLCVGWHATVEKR